MEEAKKKTLPNGPWTAVPNLVLRSKKVDSFDKVVFALISSCNPSYPTYRALLEWSGMSKERLWKSLRRLEYLNLIWRFKRGRQVEYVPYFDRRKFDLRRDERITFGVGFFSDEGTANGSPDEPIGNDDAVNGSPGEQDGAPDLSTAQGTNGSPDEPIGGEPVRQANHNGSPDELTARRTVRQANTKKKVLKKEKIKTARGRARDLDFSKTKGLTPAALRRWMRRPWREIRAELDEILAALVPRAG